MQPHRGTLILILAIVGIVTGLGFIFGPIAWIMGSKDLKEMDAGRMDPEGRSITNVGKIIGMVVTILTIVALYAVHPGLCGGFYVFRGGLLFFRGI